MPDDQISPDHETPTAEEFTAKVRQAADPPTRGVVDIIVPTRALRVGLIPTNEGAK